MTDTNRDYPSRIGIGDGPGTPCRVVAMDFVRHPGAPIISGTREPDGTFRFDRPGGDPQLSTDRVQTWLASMTPALRAFHEQMRLTFEALTTALRPLAEFIEQHPELRDMQPEPPIQGCHHLCGRWPDHECTGEATGTLAYRLGGREVPMCDGCREATLAALARRDAITIGELPPDDHPDTLAPFDLAAANAALDAEFARLIPRPARCRCSILPLGDPCTAVLGDGVHNDAPGIQAAIDRASARTPAVDPELEAARHWPAPSRAVCAHVCGPDAGHSCDARATTSLRFELPSGGVRDLPLCEACADAENAATSGPY